MKKLISYTIFLLIAILVLPSCKGRMGITKRHYTKGYYISHTKGKDRSHVAKVSPQKVGMEKMSSISALSIKAKDNLIKDQAEYQPKERMIASASPKKAWNAYSNKNISYKNITIAQRVKGIKKTALSPGSAGTREGLSLFWIIILVILILWLFGFLSGGFGMGGLINILLVVALILLILWLLRIV